MGWTSFLDPVLGPVLRLHPFLTTFILAFILTLMVTLVYKFTTDQKKMKKLKEDLKDMQTKIRELAKKDPEKAMKVQGDAMSKNLEYMKNSFRSTLFTMLPVILIFAWMSANIAYYPIAPGQEFTVSAYFAQGHGPEATISSIPDLKIIGNATQLIAYDEKEGAELAKWRLKGNAGEYKLTVQYSGETYDQRVLITPERKYLAPEQVIKNSKLQKIVVGNDKVYPFTIFGLKFNWFWAYLVMSVILSITMRKLMKVY